MKVGLFYGSETSNTKEHAFEIQELLKNTHLELAEDPIDVSNFDIKKLLEFDFIIFGSPTWNIGELQSDIADIFEDLDEINLSNKKVAVYGCGDQEGYPDTYQDAIGILSKKLVARGGELVGKTSTNGHNFENSLALENNQFMGLALDDDSQPEQSQARIKNWTIQLLKEVK